MSERFERIAGSDGVIAERVKRGEKHIDHRGFVIDDAHHESAAHIRCCRFNWFG
jgi:hypothetical protein